MKQKGALERMFCSWGEGSIVTNKGKDNIYITQCLASYLFAYKMQLSAKIHLKNKKLIQSSDNHHSSGI